jgi:class 3 adenylate cyclase/tetratricopeptide (TPR) repeat protein
MTRVADWLANLDLGQYAQNFADADIEFGILPDLTDEDLRELGLTLGHRRKFLRAAADLQASSSDSQRRPANPPGATKDSAERRQLSVMFCDLVGSTALAARLDPEEMRELLHAFQSVCADIATAYDGFLARYMGDAVLLYFGYPRAHGDDAERAVRAGLDLIASVATIAFPFNVSLEARIGIATGSVVVGDLIGAGIAQERAVVGETPNIAARLQGIAEPGSVVIAASTRLLIGNTFDLADLGLHYLKGYPEPIAVWRVTGLQPVGTRFEAMRSSRLARLVGRDPDLSILLECKRLAWASHGQIVTITGEPGIGKSRLAARLAEQMAEERHTRLQYQCSPYHSSSALYPVIQQVRLVAGLQPDDSVAQRLDKIEAVLATATPHAAASAPLIAAMLSIPYSERYPEIGLNAAQQRRQTLNVLADQIEGLAAQRPVLMLFEDIHWSDATSLELITLVSERIRHLPVLFVVTSRPGETWPWQAMPHATTIELNRLSPDDVRAIVESVASDGTIPGHAVEQIVAKADGVPLFAEELTKAVVEKLQLQSTGMQGTQNGSQSLAIPSTLQDSLMARLDNLGVVRQVAQIGSAIGRSFSYKMVAALMKGTPALLNASLDRMLEAEVIYQQGAPPDAVYTFKHALVQDAAYGSLLRSRRKELHAQIVDTIETRFPELADSEPEVVAQHCESAEVSGKAATYWLRAGLMALAQSAMPEARVRMERGLAMAASLPDGPERIRLELSLELGLGKALIATTGYAAPETGAAFMRARELCEITGDRIELLAVLHGQWIHDLICGRLLAAQTRAEELLKTAEADNDKAWILIACRANGVLSYPLGKFDEGLSYLSRGLALFDPADRPNYAKVLVDDPLVVMLMYASWLYCYLGEKARAVEAAESALAEARRTMQPYNLAHALVGRLLVAIFSEDYGGLHDLQAELAALTREHGFSYYLAVGEVLHGRILGGLGYTDDGLKQLDYAVQMYRTTRSILYLPTFLMWLADARLHAGDATTALAVIEEAEKVERDTGTANDRAEVQRLKGTILQSLGRHAEAGSCFRASVAIAEQQRAVLYHARCRDSLAGFEASAHAAAGA